MPKLGSLSGEEVNAQIVLEPVVRGQKFTTRVYYLRKLLFRVLWMYYIHQIDAN